ncbi:hypothetical protein GUITHDRAFT_163059 [Guillardia theta CCMP2712]|uniref:Uncharacterized protein n=1 Tax=Guillardia theta (strain CCMP2712) TaxID=905079 RepID=L1JDK5_GUITC|nr:hypothetical protein GUITHDRAFT_163059 [Guillardia theta CCMP2712]EKX46367.1 hypothetical protein GUITHDRAFT_163059 [Guillardia theta CCMP2712]|eukprot:XP_005833347.1 hypothetical protein GUITHDRAFT_163059 [Guillardia theta CCMP2712]
MLASRGAAASIAVIGMLLAMILLATLRGQESSELQGSDEVSSAHQARVFTMLHNMAALAAFCQHIGRVKKQKVMPCGPGATHPCCTERQLQMQKMQGGKSQSFDWADPTTWSGAKGAAAQHIANKHVVDNGWASPSAAQWQNTMMAQAQPAQYPPPAYPQPYGQAPAYPAQAQGGYYPHLLPGQGGVPEQGAPAPAQYQMPYAAAQPSYGPSMYPAAAPNYQQASSYPQQPMYGAPAPYQQNFSPMQRAQ